MFKKITKKTLACIIAVILMLGVVGGIVVSSFADTKPSRELSVLEAEDIVNTSLQNLPKKISKGAAFVAKNSSVKVNSLEYGNEKNIILNCTYTTVDIASAIEENKQLLIDSVYAKYEECSKTGPKPNATKIRVAAEEDILSICENAKPKSGNVVLTLYETQEGQFVLYYSDDTINTCLGGLLKVADTVNGLNTVKYGNKVIDITNRISIRTAIKDSFSLTNYDTQKPEVGNFIVKWCNKFAYDFNRNFIEKDRWVYLVEGLGTTLAITALAGIMGMLLGFVVAIIRCTNELTGKLKIIDKVCRAYLTLVRGTPVMVQLLIIYFVILLPIGIPKFISAVLCFGLNSGAYVAEIVRGGIMSIDKGQTEAGRSLGFNYSKTMLHFVAPQAFKAVLPALANEFITLLKESSVAFYIGVADLTQGGLKIRSLTYSSFMPLIAVAIIYLVIVLILTRLVGLLERRLRKSDH